MSKSLKAFVSDQSGAAAIEYALIASLIAVFLTLRFPRSAPASARNSTKSAAR